MKIAGLIGGMSWESTIPYYKIINEKVKVQLGGLHSAQIILYSVEREGCARRHFRLHGNRSLDQTGEFIAPRL